MDSFETSMLLLSIQDALEKDDSNDMLIKYLTQGLINTLDTLYSRIPPRTIFSIMVTSCGLTQDWRFIKVSYGTWFCIYVKDMLNSLVTNEDFKEYGLNIKGQIDEAFIPISIFEAYRRAVADIFKKYENDLTVVQQMDAQMNGAALGIAYNPQLLSRLILTTDPADVCKNILRDPAVWSTFEEIAKRRNVVEGRSLVDVMKRTCSDLALYIATIYIEDITTFDNESRILIKQFENDVVQAIENIKKNVIQEVISMNVRSVNNEPTGA